MNLLSQPEKLPELWEVSLKYLYSPEYIDGLDNFLREHNIKTILDCACGTGFPAIELSKRGYAVTCSDADRGMLRLLKEKAKKENLNIPVFAVEWGELSKVFRARSFDCVMCRGNSLVYVTSWGRKVGDLRKARGKIKRSLQNMFACLKPGGVLYIDIYSQKEIDNVLAGGGKYVESLGRKKINNEDDTGLVWEISYDQKDRIRTVHSIRTIFNPDSTVKQIKEHTYKSYLLMPNELKQMIKGLGFSKVLRAAIPGEDSYDVFVGIK